MSALDLRSLNLMAFMTSAAMGFVLLMLRRHYPGSIRGMWLWGLAPVVAASSTVFFGLEKLLPPIVVVLFGNGLLMVGCALFSSAAAASMACAAAGGHGRRSGCWWSCGMCSSCSCSRTTACAWWCSPARWPCC
ncbi:hypothetical protein [Pseudorhodoferax sp.]|uniref:hypothetical protein n=1 Tax=Pseudorhodoferax sp. TaxID=1993553 RepID=UPI002DD688F3|nr:hypothetical protein [Pseudorhodoferax sp.]